MEGVYGISWRGIVNYMDKAGIGTTQPISIWNINTQNIGAVMDDSYGIFLSNPTLAKAGTQQYSPPIVFQGNGWKTNSVASSQDVRFRMYVVPVQGAINPSSGLNIDHSINGAAYTTLVTIASAIITLGPGINSAGAVTAASFSSSNVYTENGGNITTTSTDGYVITNGTAATSGVPVQYSRRFRWSGTGWTGAASQVADFAAEVQPINGTTPITSKWILKSQINGTGYTDRLTVFDNGRTVLTNTLNLKSYTVATLPAGIIGDIAYVTDALTPTFLVAAVGGGAVVSPVFYNGAAWVTF